jgi:hypothetical protein
MIFAYKITYVLLIVISCILVSMFYNKYNYLAKIHNKLFPIYIHQIKLNSDLTKEKYYNVIMKNIPRQITNEELIFLLKYKKFMELPNVYSMCGKNEINQVKKLLTNIINNNISGCLIEMGIWRGGMSIWMQAILKYYNSKRDIYLFDTFGTFPEPNHKKDIYLYNITKLLFENPASVNDVINNFKKMNLLDNNIKFIVGKFKNTIPNKPINNIALLRCDADHYDSTKIILEHYYWKINKGGYIIIDDYNNIHVACKNAVDEFRTKYNITNKIMDIYLDSVYWQII